MSDSRQQPGPRCLWMMAPCTSLHRAGSEQRNLASRETRARISLFPHGRCIERLVEPTDAREIMDCGAGKGLADGL